MTYPKTPMEETLEGCEWCKEYRDTNKFLCKNCLTRKEERIKCIKEELVILNELLRQTNFSLSCKCGSLDGKETLCLIHYIEKIISFLKSELKLGEKI